ncbi:HAMP domain-containing sensor histidine kinase [Oscillospiraceae bacterium MB08-C2-2]|nr:HAMP domain-containing sensor histidine kinase [Oscillospiraceae bacterium MB08-C2-2]
MKAVLRQQKILFLSVLVILLLAGLALFAVGDVIASARPAPLDSQYGAGGALLFPILNGFSYILAVLWLAAGGGILYLLARYFKKQRLMLQNWEEALAQWKQGNTASPLPEEIGSIGQQLNELAASMDQAIQENRRQRDTLLCILQESCHEALDWVHSMKTYNEILAEEWRQNRAVPEFLARSDRELQRFDRSLEELKKMIQLESGAAPMHFVTLNLRWLLDEILRPFHVLARKKGLQLMIACPDTLPVDCDEEWTSAAIRTLLEYALNCVDRGDTVALSCRVLGEEIALELTFSGRGISQEDLPHIFDRYYQGRQGAVLQSTGLELALAQTIVNCHGGTLRAESSPEAGGCFALHLPGALPVPAY